MAKVTIVYHSGYGHTKIQAEGVLEGAQKVAGVTANIITSDEAIANIDQLNDADGIIFGCPTYMGSLSAEFKKFFEVASKVWFKQGWKDKIAAGFTNSGSPSGDKLHTLDALFTNAMQHGMVWVGLGQMPGAKSASDADSLNRLGAFSGAMAQSLHGEAEPVKSDVDTARLFGTRVAEATVRWVKGR